MLLITIVLIVVGIALIVAGIAIVAQALSSRSGGLTVGKSVLAVASVALGVVVSVGALGLTEIGPGQVGVKVRFGQPQEGTLTSGLHWLVPLVETAVVYDERVQAYNFEGIDGATKDLQPVKLSGLINYHIDGSQADKILQDIGGPTDYAAKVFLRPANTALKEITPRYNAAEVIGKRDEIGQLTLSALQERMEPFNIIVDRVSVENVVLNEAFLQSVEAKQIAQQDQERATFEKQRQVTLAQADAEATIERARGQAQANDLINNSLTENLLRWQTIQQLADNIRVMLLPSDQNFILDTSGMQLDE